MTTRQEVMARLKRLKGELADRYDVREIGIFGSVARDENDSGSDIDLLVEFGPHADLITYIGSTSKKVSGKRSISSPKAGSGMRCGTLSCGMSYTYER